MNAWKRFIVYKAHILKKVCLKLEKAQLSKLQQTFQKLQQLNCCKAFQSLEHGKHGEWQAQQEIWEGYQFSSQGLKEGSEIYHKFSTKVKN